MSGIINIIIITIIIREASSLCEVIQVRFLALLGVSLTMCDPSSPLHIPLALVLKPGFGLASKPVVKEVEEEEDGQEVLLDPRVTLMPSGV